MFYGIVKRKKRFSRLLKQEVQKVEKLGFFQRVHGFGQKLAIFPSFLVGKIFHEKVFHDSLEREKAFPGYKNTNLKKSKNWDFSKGVSPWF